MEFAELIQSPKLDGVILYSPLNEPVDGTLCITGHHLILSSRREGAQELWLLHQCIDHIERRPQLINNTLQGGTLVLRCKDLRIISLQIAGPREYSNVAQSVEQLSNLRDVHNLYPFFYRPMYSILEDGYTMFRAESEFAKLLSTDEWRLSVANQHFDVCGSYGAALVVPRSITDDDLRMAAAFREGGRFPMLSYRHDNGCVLLRSAQPASGASAPKRSRADEALLNGMLGRSNKKGFIVDTWGRGKTETEQHYPQWRKIARPIGPHVSHVGATLDALGRLVEACNDTACSTDRWLAKLDGSGWLTLVLNTLNTACVVAQCLDQEGSPVLVTGGSGLDAPLLVTSLVQIILHPDCRTVRGLEALIEREWIQAGYPFQSRHRRSAYGQFGGGVGGGGATLAGKAEPAATAAGSTFVLFLDCVYQLHCQFPCSFEFDAELLLVLFEHSFASQYGTFLADCERERWSLKLARRTTSLWSYLNRPNVLHTLLNPIYAPNQEVIWPSVAPISLELWSDLYLRWVIDQSSAKSTMKQIQTLVTREKELRVEALRMRKELLDLAAKFDDSLLLPLSLASCTVDSANDNGGAFNADSRGRSKRRERHVDGIGSIVCGSGASGGAASGGGYVSSSLDGGSTSSGLGGSSSTIASSSSRSMANAQQTMVNRAMVADMAGNSGSNELLMPTSSSSTSNNSSSSASSSNNGSKSNSSNSVSEKPATTGEIDHPLQT